MVNLSLLMELRNLMEKGVEIAVLNDFLKVFEFFKQIADENSDLKEELEDMHIRVQMILTDVNAKFWFFVEDGKLDYGEGLIEKPSFIFSCKKDIAAGILFGEMDMTSAYMTGDITVEGNLQDAMAYQEIIELALEAFEDLTLDETLLEQKEIIEYIKKKEDIKIKDIQFNQEDFISIEIENLIFKNHYKFELITNGEPLTILYGLNGCGKTTLLKLIFYLLTGQYDRALRVKFSKVSFKFKNGLNLSFEKKAQQVLKSSLILPNQKKFDFPLNKKRRDVKYLSLSDIKIIFRESPYWKSLKGDDNFPFVNIDTNEIIIHAREGYKYIRNFPDLFITKYSFNPIIDINLNRLNVIFVQTNRLESIESLIRIMKSLEYSKTSEYEIGKRSEERFHTQIPLKIIKSDLRLKIEQINERSNSISRKFDSEFFNLLLEQTKSRSQLKITTELINELKEELETIYNLEQELIDLGLYESPIDTKERARRILNEDQTTILGLYNALVVFNDGLKKKLEVYNDLQEKVKLFYNFIALHFKGKKLKISRQNGFQFISNNEIIIEPWELSSGEQHLVLLSYFLIFLLKPNSLILIDEPEISLHLIWQRTFISDILKLSKELNPRFIIATHSPAIIGDYNEQMLKMNVPENSE